MSNFLNKIPVSPITSFGNDSVPNGATFGTNFSILQTGGYMEVYSLSGLTYTIPPATNGIIEFSGNSIPIQFTKGTGQIFSPDVLTLNSDNISSGRRKLGMLVYVYETKKIYQYTIDNYDTLWNNATGATGSGGSTVVISDYGTTVKNNSSAGIAFISAWTSSTISGVGGYNDTNSSWRVLQTGSSSGGTFTGGTVSGATIFTNGLTANTISATTYQNLPATPFLPLSGGTVTGNTIFTSGLTATTISATTYLNYPDTFVTGFTLTSNTVTLTQNRTDGYSSFTISLSAYTGSSSTSGAFLPLSGGTVTGGTIFTSGVTANTISATTYQNLPATPFLPLSGGTVSGATIFTNGLTANTISATTYYNLPKDIFVTGGTYNNGDATFTNNSGGTFTVTGFAVGGGGGQTFYLNLSQSQGGNRLLSTTGSTASEQTSGVTISNGVTSTIVSFQSQPLNISLIPGGIWSFYLHSYKQNNNASFNIFVEVYKRTSGGTQTLLFTTDPAPVTTNSPNPSMQLSDGYFSGTPLSVSDSIVAVVRATNTGNQSHIITLVTEGSQHYSYAVSTIPTQQGLTCDTLSGCSIIQTIQTDVSNKLDKSGGTITGNLVINSGLTATTISATTYQNLPSTPFLPLSGGTIDGSIFIKSIGSPLSISTPNYSSGSQGNILYFVDITGTTNGKAINSRSNGGASSGDLILQQQGIGFVGVNTSSINPTLNYNLDVTGSFGATSVSATTISATTYNGYEPADMRTDLTNRRLGYTVSTDFLSTFTAALAPFSFGAVASGTFAVVSSQIDSQHPGVQQMLSFTGVTNSGGYVTSHAATNAFSTVFTDGLQTDLIFKLPATTTNNYIRFGHQYGSVAITAPTSGNYFEITGTTLVGITRSSSVQSATSSFTLTASTWYHARVKESVVGATTGVTFTVYDMSGVTLYNQSLTTNINLVTTRGVTVFGVNTVSQASVTAIIYLDYLGVTFPPMIRGALD